MQGKKPHHRRTRARDDGENVEPLIAFVHIPKTAGGTVTTMLSAAFSKRGISKTGNYVSDPEKSVTKVMKRPGGWEDWSRGGGRVAIGHTPYALFREHMPGDTRYVTFLREPVDRVLSHYYRHVHKPASSGTEGRRRRPGRRDRAGSLEEAVLEKRLPQLNNLATRFLCSHASLETLPDEALDEAKENLRTFMLVGIQERFEESIVLLQRTLDLGLVPTLDRHVTAPGARPTVKQISDEQRALVEEYNAFDVELYLFGRDLFDETAAAAGEGLATAVEELRHANVTAAETHKAAVTALQDWLDAELPAGTTKPIPDVVARADEAGFTRAAFNRARKEMLLKRQQGEDGVWTLARPAAEHYAAVKRASDWLEHELPAGAAMSSTTVLARAEAAGISRRALNQARKLMGVVKTLDADAQIAWTHPDED